MSALDVFTYAGQPARYREGHIYVVGFANGVVKVGLTRDPDRRIRAHIRHGKSLGVGIEAIWVSTPHKEASSNERELIDSIAAFVGRPSGQVGEFFTVAFARAVAIAEGLPKPRADEEAPISLRQSSGPDEWPVRSAIGEPVLVPNQEQFGEWAEILPRNYAEALHLCADLAREVELLRRVMDRAH